jgi:hypothetical protein
MNVPAHHQFGLVDCGKSNRYVIEIPLTAICFFTTTNYQLNSNYGIYYGSYLGHLKERETILKCGI